MPPTSGPELPRRSVLCGMAAALLVPTALSACSTEPPPAPTDPGTGTTTGGAPTGGPTTSGQALVALDEVPVGGGTVVDGPDGPVVVVRPTADEVRAFSAVCTHQGTTVNAPQGGTITCPNHGSQFAAATGEVTRGPAARPLPPVAVAVQGDQVVLA